MNTPRKVSVGSAGSPPPRLQDHSHSWTDDLPVCHLSGVGFSTNQLYREDGFRREEHEFEDKSFHFRVEGDTYLYGLFDGHDGASVSNFAAQRMPAELLLGQLAGKTDDEDIKSILKQAFLSVEQGWFESIDDVLAEKMKLQMDLPEGLTSYGAYHQYPDTFEKLRGLDSQIIGGTTAVVALIYNNKLYVANVGSGRALLCQTDPVNPKILHMTQLTTDHTLSNDHELLRMANCGANVDKLQNLGKVGEHEHTRTIGDYYLKNSYKEIPGLEDATIKPVIEEPDIVGGIPIDVSWRFLILMTDGMYKSLEVATLTERVNSEIASMVVGEFATQSTLNGVAQAVVDKVVRIHHDTYMTASDNRKQMCQKRDDITFLVRNFHQPLPNSVSSPTAGVLYSPTSAPFHQPRPMAPLSVMIPSPPSQPLYVSTGPGGGGPTNWPDALTTANHMSIDGTWTGRESGTNYTSTYTNSNESSTQSSSGDMRFYRRTIEKPALELDADGRISSYVDFSDFKAAIAAMSEAEQEQFYAEAEPRPAYESIPEESEKEAAAAMSASETESPESLEPLVNTDRMPAVRQLVREFEGARMASSPQKTTSDRPGKLNLQKSSEGGDSKSAKDQAAGEGNSSTQGKLDGV